MAQENDDEWADVEVDPTSSELATSVSEVAVDSDTTARLIRKLAEFDIGHTETQPKALKFTGNPKWGSRGSRDNHLPSGYASDLLGQLELDVKLSTKWAGILVPHEGYCEVLIGPNQGTFPSTIISNRLARLVSSDIETDCAQASFFHAAPSLTFLGRSDRFQQAFPKFHLQNGDMCLEISGPSPACHVLANTSMLSGTPRYPISVRICFGRSMSMQEIELGVEPVLNSLMYELDVRHNLNVRPVKWPNLGLQRRHVKQEQPERIIRFPEVKIDAEVSVLFGFAGSASGNPPLAFLSYYQVLENFFPLAGRKSALRQLELELSDPRFDRRSDKHLMRLLTIGENAATASESTHLRVLIEDFVRSAELISFFGDNDWGRHFTKSGPIKGMSENINLENRNIPLAYQAADRIYRIRNRIVHAKEDVKYADVPTLLPQSDEADALWPDIDLVRLLASEVILSTQIRRD